MSSYLVYRNILTESVNNNVLSACDPFAKRTKGGVDLSHDEDPSIYEDKGTLLSSAVAVNVMTAVFNSIEITYHQIMLFFSYAAASFNDLIHQN